MAAPPPLERAEKILGVPLHRTEITLESGEPYDEGASYALSQHFYGKDGELRDAIRNMTRFLAAFARQRQDSQKDAAVLYSLLGNLHYIAGNFNESANCAMRAASLNRSDITYWVELAFSLRALGEFDVFEGILFNFEGIVRLWQQSTAPDLTKEALLGLIKEAKS